MSFLLRYSQRGERQSITCECHIITSVFLYINTWIPSFKISLVFLTKRTDPSHYPFQQTSYPNHYPSFLTMPNQTRDYGGLRVTMTSEYHWAWDNNEYGTHRGATFWNPVPQEDMRTLGTVCVGKQNYWARNWRATLLFGPNPNSTSPNLAVKRPTDFTRLWWESNDHSWHMGSVWRP